MSRQTECAHVIGLEGLQQLLDVLRERGYRTLGPTVRDGAIAYEDITSVEALPRGWSDEQSAGAYRLRPSDTDTVFGFAVGPQSWKRHLFPSHQILWRARVAGGTVQLDPEPHIDAPLVLIGVRACELSALAIQDRVWLGGAAPDAEYRARRADAFIVAVNCSHAGGTCFCVSMHTGPEVTSGYDLALTELGTEGEPTFLVTCATEAGAAVLETLTRRAAGDDEIAAAQAVVARTAATMGRAMPETDWVARLLGNSEHPRWNALADRCLACGNCTMVCPTCFCTNLEDTSDLSGQQVTRTRRWDSCFSVDFAYVHGGSVRPSIRARYRQWMTHKLATWPQQFGTSGCVGCGRCISWCPVGIDLTEEVAALCTETPD